jgi:hypothetical protein
MRRVFPIEAICECNIMTWYDYDSRYNTFVLRDPDRYKGSRYEKLNWSDDLKCNDFDYVEVIERLLKEHSKSTNDISLVSYILEDGERVWCSYKDLIEYLGKCSNFIDILEKDILIKGKGDWWICYESQGVWDFFFVTRPV